MPPKRPHSTAKQALPGHSRSLDVPRGAQILRGFRNPTGRVLKPRKKSSRKSTRRPSQHLKSKQIAHPEQSTPKNPERSPEEPIPDEPDKRVVPAVEHSTTQISKKRPASPMEEIPAKRPKNTSTEIPTMGRKQAQISMKDWLKSSSSGCNSTPGSLMPTVSPNSYLPDGIEQQTPPASEKPSSNVLGLLPSDEVLANPSEERKRQSPPAPQGQTLQPPVQVLQRPDSGGPSIPPQPPGPDHRKVPIFFQSRKPLLSEPHQPQFVFRAFHSASGSEYSTEHGFTTNNPQGLNRKDRDAMCRSLGKHFNQNSRDPTHWISTTDDLLRALSRACNWEYEGKEGISIAVISTRLTQCTEFYSAEKLSWKYNFPKPVLRKTEWLFYFRVPKVAIMTCLPLETLKAGGLYGFVPALNIRSPQWGRGSVSLEDIREAVKICVLQKSNRGRWTDEGLAAGEVALLFGKGGYTDCIVRQALKWRGLRVHVELEEWEAKYVEDAIVQVLQRDGNSGGWLDIVE